jgi:hypothetical protein
VTAARPRRRLALTAIGWLAAGSLLAWAVAGRLDEFWAAAARLSVGLVLLTVALQIVALVARGEAWLNCVRGAGGTVGRRCIYRASGLGCAANLVSSYAGTAARIALLRRSAPAEAPCVSALIAAEVPILATEGVLAAIGRPTGRAIFRGLAVLRASRGRVRLVGFVLVAVVAQIARNWLMLHAVGVNASVFDAIAVLIAVVILGQLPIGPTAGAGAAVLIIGPQGVAAAVAAGLLLTATGTIGGILFAAWAGLDRLHASRKVAAGRREHAATIALHQAIARLPQARRRIIENAYFGGLSSVHISRTLGIASPGLAY